MFQVSREYIRWTEKSDSRNYTLVSLKQVFLRCHVVDVTREDLFCLYISCLSDLLAMRAGRCVGGLFLMFHFASIQEERKYKMNIFSSEMTFATFSQVGFPRLNV